MYHDSTGEGTGSDVEDGSVGGVHSDCLVAEEPADLCIYGMHRINPRLSFLRYGPGQYFKPHCDGLNDLLDGKQKSFVTLHLYLNEPDSLTGGATRFWTPDKKEHLDVEPKLGRVLVFQQRMLVQSGEEVTGGVKYTMRSDFMFEQVDS